MTALADSGGQRANWAVACDRATSPLDACLELITRYNGARLGAGKHGVRFRDRIAASCREGSRSACELVRAVRHEGVPVDRAVAPHARLLASVCQAGRVPRACMLHGKLLQVGSPIAFGSLTSRESYGYACDGGLERGCLQLTRAYRTPLASRLREACNVGTSARACTEVVTMRAFGVGLTQSRRRAADITDRACEAGDARPCVWRGNRAWKRNKRVAFAWYQRACTAGDGVSCGVTGRMRLNGEAVSQDTRRGLEVLERGCELHAGNACAELAFAYSNGQGSRGKARQAAPLYAKACSLGYIRGCAGLGVLYLDGRGVAQSHRHARWLLGFACLREDPSGCHNLGHAYARGAGGLVRDLARARWAYDRSGLLGVWLRTRAFLPRAVAIASRRENAAYTGSPAVSIGCGRSR